MANTVNFTAEQIAMLQGLQQSGNYPDAYRAIRDVVTNQMENTPPGPAKEDMNVLRNWLDTAAHINSNDKSFFSELVRASTHIPACWRGSIYLMRPFKQHLMLSQSQL